MGKVTTLNPRQKILLERIGNDGFFSGNFYFTGGTALSEFYLHHRVSQDLDFFTPSDFENKRILEILKKWGGEMDFIVETQIVEPAYICIIKFDDGFDIKVDFSRYPYELLNEPKLLVGKMPVDSELDIAVNKLLTITQRQEVKDYVDLYFLFKSYSLWDLKTGVKVKFRVDMEPLDIAAHLVCVEDFSYLPKMIQPLSLEELKSYFHQLAVKLGRKYVA